MKQEADTVTLSVANLNSIPKYRPRGAVWTYKHDSSASWSYKVMWKNIHDNCHFLALMRKRHLPLWGLDPNKITLWQYCLYWHSVWLENVYLCVIVVTGRELKCVHWFITSLNSIQNAHILAVDCCWLRCWCIATFNI